MKQLRKQPGLRSGFTLVEIMIVVLIIGILLSIAMPHFVRAREGAHARACQHNMKQILGAKERWAMDNNRNGTDAPDLTDLMPDYLRAPESKCPAGGAYTIGSLDELPICSLGGVQGEYNSHVLP
jgi:prepilin-type N-terminal cleavage/methylation domain-containing protein